MKLKYVEYIERHFVIEFGENELATIVTGLKHNIGRENRPSEDNIIKGIDKILDTSL